MRCRLFVNYIALAMIAVMLLLTGCSNKHSPEDMQKNGELAHLHLYGDLSKMNDKKDVRSITAVFSHENNRLDYYATIKVQGTSSLAYDKKNYTIKFYDDINHEEESQIDLGWGAANEYCLKANWIDKTHSRNIVTAKLAAEIQENYGVMQQAPCHGVIDGFPIELYINDRFHGIYTWNIPKSAWMFSMDEQNPDHIVMCGENWEPAGVFYDIPNLNSWSIEVGSGNEEALTKFTRLAEFIMNSSDDEFKEHFDEYLDLDATLNYYILAEFAYLRDNYGKNMLVATYDGSKWYPSLYDLDTSWGTDYTGKALWDYKESFVSFDSRNNLARRMRDVFPKELCDRYFELRENILTKEHVIELFSDFSARIPDESRKREIKRWGKKIPGYDIDQIEDYLDFAIDRLDERYRELMN